MGSRFLIGLVAGAALGLAGCGGSSISHTASTTASTGSTTAPSAASASGINVYVIKGREEPGYPPQTPADYASAKAMETGTGGYSPGDLKRLTAEGFRGAAVEQTGTAEGGLSFVFEFSSVAGAKRELQAEVREDLHSNGHPVRFSVAGIPSAVGIAYPNTTAGGGGGGGNVLWQEGRCVLLVGDTDGTSSYRKPAVAGATAIWKRTHASGVCST